MSVSSSFADKRVLVVDDSRAIRIFLQEILERHGALVREAATGGEALDVCQASESFDLILLDLVLPDQDGLRVLECIRERDKGCAVVMITGAGGIRSATEAVSKGADGYIEKQHLSTDGDDAAFLHALERALEHRAGVVAQQQLQDVKADFYSMVTHDLRNPAGNVWGVLRLLLAGKAGPLTPQQEQLVTLGQTSAEKLVGLINDYLDYATIEAGYLRVERAEVELQEVVEAVTRLASPQASVKGQVLEVELPDEPLRAEVDASRLEQVLENLVSNAIKYTPGGGRIRVELAVEEDDAVFRVRDTGIGIPPQQIPLLFARFHRVPGEATRGIQGTGLGLLIVKEIVQAHGGSIHAESTGERGEGSTFLVRIPLRAA